MSMYRLTISPFPRLVARRISLKEAPAWKSPITRAMSTGIGGKKEFLCILPDKPNVLDIRKKVRSAHYEGIKPLIESGRLVVGGAMLEAHPGENQDVPFKGSMIVYTGDNEDDVRRLIQSDIYAQSGVWDLSKVQIIPYKSAVRQPMS